MSGNYAAQDRGGIEKLQAYRDQMNRLALPKLAVMAFFLPNEGHIVDMGSGSGLTTYILAKLFPNLRFTGVDINPDMVRLAQEEYGHLPNLTFRVGNIADMLFADRSVHGTYNSASLHHVDSFEGRGYDVQEVVRAIGNQVRQTDFGGVVGNRDFVIAPGPQWVEMRILKTEGSGNPADDPKTLSTHALFDRFARDFRSSVHREGPVAFEDVADPDPRYRRVRLDFRTALEFMHHMKYTENWKAEIKEEYLYATQPQIEQLFQFNGLRISNSRLIYNTWIYENHNWNAWIELYDLNGRRLQMPPTNMLVVGQLVEAGEGIEIRETASEVLTAPRFVKVRHLKNARTQEIYQVAHRPGNVVDLLPYFERDGQTYIVNRVDYPRPIINFQGGRQHLMGGASGGYIVEPISAVWPENMEADDVVAWALRQKLGLSEEAARGLNPKPLTPYYPSPGGIAERVTPYTVEVPFDEVRFGRIPNDGPFSTLGSWRYTEIRQALRAFHVGGSYDSRLEINIYRLLRALNQEWGPWVGTQIALTPSERPTRFARWEDSLFSETASWIEQPTGPDFLEIRRGHFEEFNASGFVTGAAELEYVLPKHVSHHTVSVLPVFHDGSKVWVGIERRDLPAPQLFSESSTLVTSPAFRVPKTVRDREQLLAYAEQQMRDELGLRSRRLFELGYDYRVSAGITPEIVYPFIMEVDVASIPETARGGLYWIPLNDLLARESRLNDAQLLTSLFRFAHSQSSF